MIQIHSLVTNVYFYQERFFWRTILSWAQSGVGIGWVGESKCKGPEARKSFCHVQEIEKNLLWLKHSKGRVGIRKQYQNRNDTITFLFPKEHTGSSVDKELKEDKSQSAAVEINNGVVQVRDHASLQ